MDQPDDICHDSHDPFHLLPVRPFPLQPLDEVVLIGAESEHTLICENGVLWHAGD